MYRHEELKKLNKEQCVRLAVFCAEQVLHVYEKEYPDDERPYDAISIAKKWLEDPKPVVFSSGIHHIRSFCAGALAINPFAGEAAFAASFAVGAVNSPHPSGVVCYTAAAVDAAIACEAATAKIDAYLATHHNL